MRRTVRFNKRLMGEGMMSVEGETDMLWRQALLRPARIQGRKVDRRTGFTDGRGSPTDGVHRRTATDGQTDGRTTRDASVDGGTYRQDDRSVRVSDGRRPE